VEGGGEIVMTRVVCLLVVKLREEGGCFDRLFADE